MVVVMGEQSLYAAYFLASFGSALSALFMVFFRMFKYDLLCMMFVMCIFGVTFTGAIFFSTYGASAGIIFTLIMSISLPWVFTLNYRMAQMKEDSQIFQIVFGCLLCLTGIAMSRIIGELVEYFRDHLPYLTTLQWLTILLFCNLFVGLGGVIISVRKLAG